VGEGCPSRDDAQQEHQHEDDDVPPLDGCIQVVVVRGEATKREAQQNQPNGFCEKGQDELLVGIKIDRQPPLGVLV